MSTPGGARLFYNEDCIEGCKQHLDDDSVDLIVTDPPYGIGGDKLHKHYNRKEKFVIDGYVEVPQAAYAEFSLRWIQQAERILRPGGSLYLVSGYTNLGDILNGLRATSLKEVNHLIWKYNFGVYTRKKYVSSHYHILYYIKPGGDVTFNTNCRFGPQETDGGKGKLNYQDREDVWIINREYKPGKQKNKNELPTELLSKIMQYSSNEGDLVCDLFLGSFSTAKVALGLNRRACGFEMSEKAFQHQLAEVEKIEPGHLLAGLRKPEVVNHAKQNERWTIEEKQALRDKFVSMVGGGMTKKRAIKLLGEEFGRGHWSITKLVADLTPLKSNKKKQAENEQLDLFSTLE